MRITYFWALVAFCLTTVFSFLPVAYAQGQDPSHNPSFELRKGGASDFGGEVIAAGDFNNDRIPDIVYPGGASDSLALTLQLGNGDGTFQAPITLGDVDSSSVGAIAAADFNRDGNLDIAVQCIGGTVDIFYGNGHGGVTNKLSVSLPYTPISMTVADFNGDSLPDFAIGDSQGHVEIFNNVGGNSFVLKSTTPIESNSYITVYAGNFDGDGIQSLAIMTNTTAYVLWNDGHENFWQQPLGGISNPVGLGVGDLNQDGMDDILFSYDCNPQPESEGKGPYSTCQGVQAFYGQGNQKLFQRQLIVSNGVGASGSILAADVNGDGIADIVTAQVASGAQAGIFVFLGHPDGSYNQASSNFTATSDSLGPIVAADFNRDGMIDFAGDLPGSGQNEIFINATLRNACATSQINPTVTACAPINNTYLPAPNINVQANAYDQNQVTAMQLYVNGSLKYSQPVTSFNQNSAMSPGANFLVIKAWDYTGLSFRTQRNITVYNGTPGSTCWADSLQANICLPNTATSTSPVHIVANGYANHSYQPDVPTAAQLYIDNALVIDDRGCGSDGECPGGVSAVDTYQTLSPGDHDLVFKLWTADGDVFTAQKTITVQ